VYNFIIVLKMVDKTKATEFFLVMASPIFKRYGITEKSFDHTRMFEILSKVYLRDTDGIHYNYIAKCMNPRKIHFMHSKIGITNDIQRREHDKDFIEQCAEIVYCKSSLNTMKIEQMLHCVFNDRLIIQEHKEWFDISQDDAILFSKLFAYLLDECDISFVYDWLSYNAFHKAPRKIEQKQTSPKPISENTIGKSASQPIRNTTDPYENLIDKKFTFGKRQTFLIYKGCPGKRRQDGFPNMIDRANKIFYGI
jgi:hypothetical protein